jgi:long-chain fatty acid transport protein
LTLGLGLFVQGGARYKYWDLNTAFGTRDDLVSLFGLVRLTPGVAWQATDNLALGASLLVSYATLEQEILPETSFFNADNPDASFFGFEIDKTETFATGYKLGAQYRINDWITADATYSNKIDLTFDDASAQFNFSARGLGRVTYRDVTLEGLSQAQELGLGLALRPRDALLLAFGLTWLDWSNAVRQATLRACDPDHPAAPAAIELITDFNWRDQYVAAVGIAYDLTPSWRLRAGYNYGHNPVPDRHMNPTLQPLLSTI